MSRIIYLDEAWHLGWVSYHQSRIWARRQWRAWRMSPQSEYLWCHDNGKNSRTPPGIASNAVRPTQISSLITLHKAIKIWVSV